MTKILGLADHARHRGFRQESDEYGSCHLILFGDFKQLPPATSKPPFIYLPRVHGGTFDFRVLRQNRRVISDVARRDEIENFHGILHDVAHGVSSDRVKFFLVQAYVRGAQRGCAEDAPFEGVTSVFAKRRYRDAYNRTIVKRIGKTHNHTLKVKARVRARGQRGGGFYGEKKVAYLRRKCKTQNLWLLQLAGDFHTSYETEEVVDPTKQHMMRAMLSANLAVDARFVVAAAAAVLCISSILLLTAVVRPSCLSSDRFPVLTGGGHGKRNAGPGHDVPPQVYERQAHRFKCRQFLPHGSLLEGDLLAERRIVARC